MKSFSKQLAASLNVPQGGDELPILSYRYQARNHYPKSSLSSGIRLHSAFADYAQGQWVDPEFYYACAAVEEALAELAVVEVHSEVELSKNGINGVTDLHGTLQSGRPVVVELKSTLGEYSLAPAMEEVFQMATYAYLLDYENPLLLCVRVALRMQSINVFKVETERAHQLMRIVETELATEKAA